MQTIGSLTESQSQILIALYRERSEHTPELSERLRMRFKSLRALEGLGYIALENRCWAITAAGIDYIETKLGVGVDLIPFR